MAEDINEDLMEIMRDLGTSDPIFMNSDRGALIERQLEMIDSSRNEKSKLPPLEKFTLLNRAPNRSLRIIPLAKENMIFIRNIMEAGPDFVHEGKFLLCRSIMPAVTTNALMLVIDDPTGDQCSRVSISNFTAVIRPGTILAIMHPWYDEIEVAIGVENPMHIRLIDRDEDLIRDIVWKEPLPKESGAAEEKPIDDPAKRGNVHFVDKNYATAMVAYSRAIQADPVNPLLYSNRAVTYLKMERPDEALEDTEIGLKLQPSNLKLLYRKGKALIGLKRYEEAASFLVKASREHEEVTKDKTFADLVKASKRMVNESKSGNYDIMGMLEVMERSKLLENHADYYASDKLEVKQIPGKGRGLIAKVEIEAGTLLMASKAFAYAEKSEGSVTAIDLSTKIAESDTFVPLIRKICAKLINNPKLGDDFYKLYAGKSLGWVEMIDHTNPVDIDRISGIVNSNTFSGADAIVGAITSGAGSSGLWIGPSYINHACVMCNCCRLVIGDFILVRAMKDINPGEELVTEYTSAWHPYEQRRRVLDRSFGFECSCVLCQLDRSHSEEVRQRLYEIDKLVVDFNRRANEGSFDTTDVFALKKLLEEALTYRQELNFPALKIKKLLGTAGGGKRMDAAEMFRFTQEMFNDCQRAGDLYKSLIYAIGLAKFERGKVGEWTKIKKKLSKILCGDERIIDLVCA